MEGHPNTPPIAYNKKTKQRAYAALAAFAFTALVVVVFNITTSRSPTSVRTAEVQVTSSGFQPATITVKEGTKITWTNDDAVLHQIAANPFPQATDLPGLKSQILNNKQTYTYVATTAGTFGYHDQLKPTINGTLVVKK